MYIQKQSVRGYTKELLFLKGQTTNTPSSHNNRKKIFAWCPMHESFSMCDILHYYYARRSFVIVNEWMNAWIKNEQQYEGICEGMKSKFYCLPFFFNKHCFKLEYCGWRTLGLWMNNNWRSNSHCIKLLILNEWINNNSMLMW